MNARKLAEEARRLATEIELEFCREDKPTNYQQLAIDAMNLRARARKMADALIAQADLLDEYRHEHIVNHGCDLRDYEGKRRCDTCRAYDKLKERPSDN